jgi:hypothetical protein
VLLGQFPGEAMKVGPSAHADSHVAEGLESLIAFLWTKPPKEYRAPEDRGDFGEQKRWTKWGYSLSLPPGPQGPDELATLVRQQKDKQETGVHANRRHSQGLV